MRNSEIDEYISKDTEKAILNLWKKVTLKDFQSEREQYEFLVGVLNSSASEVIVDLRKRDSYGLKPLSERLIHEFY